MSVVTALLLGCSAALAVSSYLSGTDGFNAVYPNSKSGTNASCNLCHSNGGGTDLNGYGKDFAQVHNAGSTVRASFAAIENLNSDKDPAAATNITEINASTQPGWTTGANNTLYDLFTLAVKSTGNSPPSSIMGSLDPAVSTPNQPPVLSPIGAQSVNVGQTLTFTAKATDPDGDALTFSAGNLPTGAMFTPMGVFTWTPTASQVGNFNVTITVTDNGSPPLSASQVVTITVGSVNRPPVLSPVSTSQTATVGQLKTIQFSATDPDGNSLTFAGSNLPTGATLTDNHNGTATFSWTPTAAQVGVFPNITVTVTDNGTPPQSASVQFTITVMSANQPPVMNPIGNKTVNEGQTLAFMVTATDPDGDTLTYSATGLPSGATFTPAGAFSWTPSFSQAGNYTVTFTVTDSGTPAQTASQTITITVGNVNAPPVLNPIGNQTVNVGQLLTFTATATDPDGDKLTFSSNNLPTGATLSTSGVFSWTPTSTQAGNYTVTITVTDNGTPPQSASTTFTITVGSVNRPPVLSPNPIGNRTVTEGQTLTIAFTASDPDSGETLTFTASNLPSGATLTQTGGNGATFSWTPKVGQAGTYPNITITVSDGSLTASGSFTITVLAATQSVNQPPVLTNPGPKTVTAGQLLTFTLTASDPDGDALTFSSANLPSGATLTPNGVFSWTPTAGQVGNYSVTVTVVDNGTPPLTSAPQTFMITVLAAPQGASVRITEAEWEHFRLQVEGMVQPGGQTVTILDAVSGQTLGTVTASAQGTWEFTVTLSPPQAPCSVRATAGGQTSAVVTVKGVRGNCNGGGKQGTETEHEE